MNEFNLRELAAKFHEEDLEWRIGQAYGDSAKVLCYITARAVMHRLDTVVGPENWKDRYWREPGGVMCGLAIKVGGEWVEKVDGSDETDVEAFKGGISKALVRTGVKWGIGRYLYQLTDGWARFVPKGTPGANYLKGKNGEALYWLPPQLPAWALPEGEEGPAAPAQSASRMETKTRAANAALKGNPSSGPKNIITESKPEAKAGGRGAAPAARAGADEDPYAFFDPEGSNNEAGGVHSHAPAGADGTKLSGVRRATNAADLLAGDVRGNRGGDSGRAGNAGGAKAPGKSTGGERVAGNGARLAPANDHEQASAQAQRVEGVSAHVPGGRGDSAPASGPANSPGVFDGRNFEAVNPADSLYVSSVVQQLGEARSLSELQTVWALAVERTRGFSPALKNQLTAAKDEAKKRFS